MTDVLEIKWLCCTCGHQNAGNHLDCTDCGKQRWSHVGVCRAKAVITVRKLYEIWNRVVPEGFLAARVQ